MFGHVKVPSPTPARTARAASTWPRAAASSWTRSATWTCVPGQAAARAPGAKLRGARLEPQPLSGRAGHLGDQPRSRRRWSRRAPSARISSIVSISSPSICRRCASAVRTSPCWPSVPGRGGRRSTGAPAGASTRRGQRWLAGAPWPGNVRQLRHLLVRSLLICDSDPLGRADFERVEGLDATEEGGAALPAPGRMTLPEIERAMILKCLAYHGGNISRAAESLGLSRAALYRRMEKPGSGREDRRRASSSTSPSSIRSSPPASRSCSGTAASGCSRWSCSPSSPCWLPGAWPGKPLSPRA